MRKLDIGHYAFALKTEVQGGVQLSLSASCAKFTTDTQARVILSEQLKQDGSINFPMYTGATFESNFSLASGGAQLQQLEHHEQVLQLAIWVRREPPFLRHSFTENDQFTKTGSEQT